MILHPRFFRGQVRIREDKSINPLTFTDVC